MTPLSLVSSLAALAVVTAPIVQASAAGPAFRISLVQVAPTLRPLVPKIQAGLPRGMAMRLPRQLEGTTDDGRKFPLYGIIQSRNNHDQFTLQLVITPDCEVRACLVGYIAVASHRFKASPRRGEETESIPLTSGIRGQYVYRSFPNNAALPPVHIVVWEQDGFAYIVSSTMKKWKVLEIAKSMATGAVIPSHP
ncbi:hypothetical protein BST81_19655 [Leptolyngbya sp. 'hensonii']|uniref:hypothetical protein n=1 Tax=Leptolyngbya sp. 'hensonii' TaxID=1922337 RepID=UPI00094FFEE5|nr:hypothetical protein [Leptolyngbya sp. 'hensonii']OLP16655.1 hypothetical protein BST81_19655 [Leptolyngbya sp. 'hensonii']